jgi:CRP-like cAMP-binding protein
MQDFLRKYYSSSTSTSPCESCSVKSHNICQPLDNRRQRELFEYQQSWEKGQLLYRADDPLGPIFKIISGIVAVSTRLPDGRRQILDFFFPGEICGYSEADGQYAFEGEAITPVRTCVFGRARFKAFTRTHADLAEIIRATLAWKLEGVSHHLAELGQLASMERVAAFLCWLRVRYAEHGMSTRPMALPMSREAIADYLGMRIETLSRCLTNLRRLEIIEATDTEVVVFDQARLAALSGLKALSTR